MYENKEKYFKGIRVPRDIDFTTNDEDTKLKIHINYPERNMQCDEAAFEGWACIFRAYKNYEVEISFKSSWDGNFKDLSVAMPNYMRFLFRLWKFDEGLNWVSISEGECKKEVNRIEEMFEVSNFINNVPGSECEKPSEDKPDYNERLIEWLFVTDKRTSDLPISYLRNENLKKLYNQLPTGLFEKEVKEANRILSTGFIDLWGLNDKNKLYVFELKDKGNCKVGIISELFMYANYVRVVFMDKKYNKKDSPFRGYNELKMAAEEGISQIKACFLVDDIHSEIGTREREILEILNSVNKDIEYMVKRYNKEKLSILKI